MSIRSCRDSRARDRAHESPLGGHEAVKQKYGLNMPEVLGPLIVLLAILAIDLWVYADARRWAAQGAPVVARIGSFAAETPETWFLGCLVLFIFFFPLYMVSRAG